MVTGANVLALLRGTRALFDFGPGDRWALFHSPSFDVSVWELWGAFAYGGCCVVVPRDVATSPDAFVAFLAEWRITVLNQMPSVFRYVAMAYEDAGAPPLALRYVVFAGEAVSLDTVAAFAAATGAAAPRFINMYGITETTVHSTFKLLDAKTLASGVRSPIGHALPHLEIALLDEGGAPVADGETGEIWVAGEGVAEGYLRRPELTAARFVGLTIGGGPARRHYRSGDLARRLEDGALEYLGRNDDQLKLRGFRIEPAEIEHALRAHAAVRDVAVVLGFSQAGEEQLVAFVVGRDDAEAPAPVDGAALRDLATRQLPGHMLPSRFVVCADLPRTPSGKIDRKVLTAQADARSAPAV